VVSWSGPILTRSYLSSCQLYPSLAALKDSGARDHFDVIPDFDMATASREKRDILAPADKEKLKQAFDISHFDLNAVIRGIQLTLVGGKDCFEYSTCIKDGHLADPSDCVAHRALQNPAIFTSEHYRQAAIAVAAGIAIRLLVAIPVRFDSLDPERRSLLTGAADRGHSGALMVQLILCRTRHCFMG
jgi:hypothetical protein